MEAERFIQNRHSQRAGRASEREKPPAYLNPAQVRLVGRRVESGAEAAAAGHRVVLVVVGAQVTVGRAAGAGRGGIEQAPDRRLAQELFGSIAVALDDEVVKHKRVQLARDRR